MNYGIIRKILGKILFLMGIVMVLPLIICLIYKESFTNYLSFIIPALVLFGLGSICNFVPVKNERLTPREGFIIVALSWIIVCLFGAVPFVISGVLPNYFDAFFEFTSGFTTTGASVIPDVEILLENNHSIFFFRSFSHWIGGMGILVFILAIIPESKEGSIIHILRAESPGPQVGKLVSKMSASSRILYLIYVCLTLIEIILLWSGPDMNLYQSLIYSFGSAGTGGFAINNNSVAAYGSYSQYVISIFMIIFAVNFTIYYLLLIGNFKDIIHNEELRTFFIIIASAVVILMITTYNNNFEETFRICLFQVASIISTTGFCTIDYVGLPWPAIAKFVIILLMIFGGCAGSTGGGTKVSRLVIVMKSSLKRVKNMANPRKVETIRVDGKVVDKDVVDGVLSFICVYFVILIACAGLISIFDNYDLITNFTASLSCISNVGPGLSLVGPAGNYSIYSAFSKVVLSIEMIAGRLELFPILILLNIKTWLNK